MIAALLLLAQAAPIASAPVADPELAQQRGGFQLPNGVDVALTVQTQTAVDGAVVLRTVFKADVGTPTLTVFTPKPGMTVQAGPSNGVSEDGGVGTSAAVMTPTVSYDPRTGIQVTPGVSAPAINITSGHAAAEAAPPADLQTVDARGAGVATAAGLVTQVDTEHLRTVQLQGADLAVTHFAGNAFGSAIANSGSDRAIDTQTTVSLDLSNAGPDVLGSAMLRAMDVASAATAMRAQ